MSLKNKKVTEPVKSAATDNEQSLKSNKTSITKKDSKINEKFEIDDMQENYRQINSPDYLHTVSLTELYDTAYQPKEQIIDNLLCSGVYLFAGATKVGESFFMAQLGYHVSSGIDLWEYQTHKGAVLYLALEDNYARLQKRLSKMFGVDSIDNFHFATHAKNLNYGLDSQLKRFMEEHKDTKLIIIDTLQRIREAGSEKYSYGSDYEIITRLKQFADHHNICILIVHHTRKQSSEDCFDMISGTNGLLGAADGAFIMQKEKRTDNKAILEIVGRDQQDQKLHLRFNGERCIWELTKTETELWKEAPEPLLEIVSKIVTAESPEWVGSASELLIELNKIDEEIEINPNVLMRKLNIGADKLWNEYGIRIENRRTHAGRIVKLTFENITE